MKCTLKSSVVALALSLIVSVNAMAIVSIGWIDPKLTPVLSSAMPKQWAAFVDRYKNDPPTPGEDPAKNFYLKFDGKNVDAAIDEIKLTLSSGRSRQTDDAVIAEYAKSKARLIKNGYESSTNNYWAPPKELVVFYDREVGPQFEHGMNGEPDYYLHSMTFELWENFQKKNSPLSDGDIYPRTVLSGWVFFACLDKFDRCSIANALFRESGLRYESIPSTRSYRLPPKKTDGGNSSAGGGK